MKDIISNISDFSIINTLYGKFKILAFSVKNSHQEHAVLIKETNGFYNIRIHSECITGDVFDSLQCDCGSQLNNALKFIEKNGGVLIYLRQEGRGIGLINKINAYALQNNGMDTVDANLHNGHRSDEREYSAAVAILDFLEIYNFNLITNNPEKIKAFQYHKKFNVNRIFAPFEMNSYNEKYIKTKINKMNHQINLSKCEL